MKNETNLVELEFGTEGAVATEEGNPVKCTLEVPDGWSVTAEFDRGALILPENLDDADADAFVPNVVISSISASTDGTQPGASLPEPPVVFGRLSSSEPGYGGVNGHKARCITMSADEKHVLFQLVASIDCVDGTVTAAASATKSQWVDVANAFDRMIDSLMLSDTHSEVGHGG